MPQKVNTFSWANVRVFADRVYKPQGVLETILQKKSSRLCFIDCSEKCHRFGFKNKWFERPYLKFSGNDKSILVRISILYLKLFIIAIYCKFFLSFVPKSNLKKKDILTTFNFSKSFLYSQNLIFIFFVILKFSF